jgi:hypothetical protein
MTAGAAAYADRVILLADGQLAGMLEAPSADEVAEQLWHAPSSARPSHVRAGNWPDGRSAS